MTFSAILVTCCYEIPYNASNQDDDFSWCGEYYRTKAYFHFVVNIFSKLCRLSLEYCACSLFFFYNIEMYLNVIKNAIKNAFLNCTI